MSANPTFSRADVRPGGYTSFTYPPLGDICHVKQDAALSSPPSSALELAALFSRDGLGFGLINLAGSGLTITGPVTFTIDLLGVPIPFTLTVRVRDVTLGTDTDTDYAMGPSLTTVSTSLTSNEICQWLCTTRRF